MIYVLTKAAHLVSLFVWIGGMVAVAVSLRFPALTLMERLKAYDRAVTTPAMILAWSFGILLAVQGGWFSQSWLGLKILLVLVFSGLHGALAGRLRRATKGPNEPEASGPLLMLLGFVLVTLIVLLVTIKP
ncbi:MAG: CopD family protein [Pseudomonadota bacterium]